MGLTTDILGDDDLGNVEASPTAEIGTARHKRGKGSTSVAQVPANTLSTSLRFTEATTVPAPTTAASAHQNSGQPSENVAIVIEAPVQVVAAQVSANGCTVPKAESSGPEVKTDGYEDYSGEWETLPGEDIRSSEAGSHGLPKARVRSLDSELELFSVRKQNS